MDFLPDGTFLIEDPAALKIPTRASGAGTASVLPGPGSRRRIQASSEGYPFLDDGGLRVHDDAALQVPDLNRWEPSLAAGPGSTSRFELEPISSIGIAPSSTSWDWMQPGLLAEPWMQTMAQDLHEWEKIGKSWDWMAKCCSSCGATASCGQASPLWTSQLTNPAFRRQGSPGPGGGRSFGPDLKVIGVSPDLPNNPWFPPEYREYVRVEEKPWWWWLLLFSWCEIPTAWSLRDLSAQLNANPGAAGEAGWGLWHCIYHALTTNVIRTVTEDEDAHSLDQGVSWEAIEPSVLRIANALGLARFPEPEGERERRLYWRNEQAEDILVYNPAGVACADKGATTWWGIWCCCKKEISNRQPILEFLANTTGRLVAEAARAQEINALLATGRQALASGGLSPESAATVEAAIEILEVELARIEELIRIGEGLLFID